VFKIKAEIKKLVASSVAWVPCALGQK